MPTPRVSVLMSVYNGEPYLKEAVESILLQSFEDFEFVIVEDASTDGTAKILQEFAASDIRIHLLHNPRNLGLTRSLNRGLEVVRGEYVARQDADDVSVAQRLEKQVAFLEARPEVGLVSSLIEYIDAQGRPLNQPHRESHPDLIAWMMLFYNHLGGHSQVMFRRRLVLDLQGYSETRPLSQDYELWLRLMRRAEIGLIPDVLVRYRAHEGRLSATRLDEQTAYCVQDARANLSQLVEKEVSSAEMENLRGFWTHPFPASPLAGPMNRLLKQTYRNFLRRRRRKGRRHPEVAEWIRSRISRRFNRWACECWNKRGGRGRVGLIWIAFRWSPIVVLDYYIMDRSTKRVNRMVLVLVRKAYRAYRMVTRKSPV